MKIVLKNVKVNNELYDELKQFLLTRVGEKIKVKDFVEDSIRYFLDHEIIPSDLKKQKAIPEQIQEVKNTTISYLKLNEAKYLGPMLSNFERINNDVSETKLLLKLLFEAVYDTSSKSPDDIVRIRKEIENIYVNSTTD